MKRACLGIILHTNKLIPNFKIWLQNLWKIAILNQANRVTQKRTILGFQDQYFFGISMKFCISGCWIFSYYYTHGPKYPPNGSVHLFMHKHVQTTTPSTEKVPKGKHFGRNENRINLFDANKTQVGVFLTYLPEGGGGEVI